MSAAITFQVAREVSSSRLSQASCVAAEEHGLRPGLALHIVGVGAAIGAHVDEEDVEHRPVRDLAVDAAGFLRRGAIGMNSWNARAARAASSGTIFSV